MKSYLVRILPLLLLFVFGCEEKDCCGIQEAAGRESLTGSWLLFEQGYSPGSGYFVNEVPEDPPQAVTFHDDGTITSSVKAWEGFTFYLIFDDPNAPDHKILALFKTAPITIPSDTSHLQTSYSITFSEGRVKLFFRWCIEGCHLGFKPI